MLNYSWPFFFLFYQNIILIIVSLTELSLQTFSLVIRKGQRSSLSLSSSGWLDVVLNTFHFRAENQVLAWRMINFFFLNHLSDFGKDFDKNFACSIRESRFSRVILQISVKLCPTSAARHTSRLQFIQIKFSFLLTCSMYLYLVL